MQQNESPWRQPLSTWKRIVVETWNEAGRDNISLIAAGVAFYAFVSIVPVLASIVLTYGLIASPATVVANVRSLTDALPADTARLIGGQLREVVHSSDGKKGVGLFVAIAIALWGARNAAGSVITALNVAYEVEEKRGFVMLNLLALTMTMIAVLIAVMAGAATAVLAFVQSWIPGGDTAVVVVTRIGSYLLLAIISVSAAAALFDFGPCHPKRRWVWLSPGAVVFAVTWLALTLGFGFYVANFGNYNATYGSLSAIIVALTWIYFSAYLLLLGAELNGEFAKQMGAAPFDPAAVPAVADERAPGGSLKADYIASRAANRIAGGKIGMVTSAAATIGLGWIRRRDRAVAGIGLLAAAAGVSWLRRDRCD